MDCMSLLRAKQQRQTTEQKHNAQSVDVIRSSAVNGLQQRKLCRELAPSSIDVPVINAYKRLLQKKIKTRF